MINNYHSLPSTKNDKLRQMQEDLNLDSMKMITTKVDVNLNTVNISVNIKLKADV